MSKPFDPGDTECYWVNCKERMPEKTGTYIVFAPSADPEKPMISMAWYEDGDEYHRGWYRLPQVWRDAITHWARLPEPPDTPEIPEQLPKEKGPFSGAASGLCPIEAESNLTGKYDH